MAYNVAANLRVAMPDPIGVDQLKRRNALADMQAQTDQNRNALYAQQLSQNDARMKADEQAALLEQVRAWAPGAYERVLANPAEAQAFVAQAQKLGITAPDFDVTKATPADVEQIAMHLGLPKPKAAPKYSVTEQPGPFGSRIVTDGERFTIVEPPKPASAGEKGPNKQLVTRPTPDGRQQDYAFNPQTSQLEPVGEAYAKTAPLSPKDTTTAKQKLTQIAIAKQQLANAKAKFAEIRNSFSAGAGGGLIPTPKGKAFDAAIDGMRGSITALTRVPGVGAMSDYETRLDQAKFPTRNDYEDVIAQKLDQLDALIGGLDTGYRDLLGGPSDTAAPADAGAPKPGMVQDGYRFKGGNPADKANWVKVGK